MHTPRQYCTRHAGIAYAQPVLVKNSHSSKPASSFQVFVASANPNRQASHSQSLRALYKRQYITKTCTLYNMFLTSPTMLCQGTSHAASFHANASGGARPPRPLYERRLVSLSNSCERQEKQSRDARRLKRRMCEGAVPHQSLGKKCQLFIAGKYVPFFLANKH